MGFASTSSLFDKQKSQFWPLLKSVSRSFYLSLRYLPGPIQQPMSLAYLLARLTDSIADCNACSVNYRKEAIGQLKELINAPDQPAKLTRLQEHLLPELAFFPQAEQTLIKSIPFLLALLRQQLVKHQLYIQEVLYHIIEGQLIDLQFFDTREGVTSFSTDQELERYLYLVAGCVGEFWTKICCDTMPHYSTHDLSYLLPKAVNFGKALQLTNILRDIPVDLHNGRFYLPWTSKDKMEVQALCSPQNVDRQLPLLIDKWHHQALSYLNDAELYIHAVNNRRIRFACLVPFYLAQKTLHLLKNQNYLYAGEQVKVKRREVYFYLWNALLHTTLIQWNRHG